MGDFADDEERRSEAQAELDAMADAEALAALEALAEDQAVFESFVVLEDEVSRRIEQERRSVEPQGVYQIVIAYPECHEAVRAMLAERGWGLFWIPRPEDDLETYAIRPFKYPTEGAS